MILQLRHPSTIFMILNKDKIAKLFLVLVLLVSIYSKTEKRQEKRLLSVVEVTDILTLILFLF